MFLLCEDEIVVVASVDRSGNTIDVYERGAGESTAVAHTGTITMKVIGNAHEEGSSRFSNGRTNSKGHKLLSVSSGNS